MFLFACLTLIYIHLRQCKLFNNNLIKMAFMELSWAVVRRKKINYSFRDILQKLTGEQDNTAVVDAAESFKEETSSETSTVESYSTVNLSLLTPIRSRTASDTSGALNNLDNDIVESKTNSSPSNHLDIESGSTEGSTFKTRKLSERPCSSAPEHTPVKEKQGLHRNTTAPLLNFLHADNLNAEGCSEASNVKTRLFNGSKLSNSSSTASLPLSYYYFDDSYEFSCRAGDGSNSVTRVEKNSEEHISDTTAVTYKANSSKLYLPLADSPTMSKPSKISRKKKRSASWYNVLNPSYKQKNDAFHKCFKQLPETERLLVDCSCALLKDLIIQGRMYISQNYVCFHSTILRWQTAIVIKFKDIEQITKEKTVKVIPNAIQFQVRGRKSPTFTSFTQRDRTYQQIYKLWQNTLADTPMTPQELWGQVHSQYGTDLGCSSDEDYVKPEASVNEEFSKKKSKKKLSPMTLEASNHVVNGFSDQLLEPVTKHEQSTEESKFSSQESTNGFSEKSSIEDCSRVDNSCSDEDEPCDHAKEDLDRTFLNREFPVSAKQLFETIFGESNFWKRYLQGKRCQDIEFETWQRGCGEYEGSQQRNLSYNLPLTNPLVPKSSHVEEFQVFYKESIPGRCYVVDCIARTYGVPYSNYFSTIMRYAIRKTSSSKSELRITAQVHYYKTPWALVKNFIEKNVNSGMEENFELLERELTSHCDQMSRVKSLQSTSSPVINRNRSASGSSSKSNKLTSDTPCPGLDSPNLFDTSEINESDKIKAAPSTDPLAVPRFSHFSKKHIHNNKNDSSNGKWLWRFLAVIFFLLLWSNYSMYQRICVLEKLNSNIPLDGDASTDMISNDCVYEINGSRDRSLTQSLRSLQHRFNVLEQLVRNLSTSTDRQWSSMNNHWKKLEETVGTFIEVIKAKDTT